MDAAETMTSGGLEGGEASTDASTGYVLEPEAPQLSVLGKCVEVQRLVPVRVVVAARHAARKARHGCAARPGPAHRPPEPFDGRVGLPPPAPRRAAPHEALGGLPLLPSGRAGLARRPVTRIRFPLARAAPPARPPACTRESARGRREGPPGKEDYAPHNAPRQKPLTSGPGAGLFWPLSRALQMAHAEQILSPTRLIFGGLERHIGSERCRLDRPLQRLEMLMEVGRRTLLQCASAMSMCPQKLQVPQCLALNPEVEAWSAA